MKLGEFIKNYRERFDMSQRQFANRCGLSNGYISILEKGVNPKTKKPVTPTIPQLKKLADGMGMSMMELMDKVDDMDVDLSAVLSLSDSGILPSNVIPMPEMRQISLLGAIACGEPILAAENIGEYINIPKHIKADFALTCKGDSMINARIFDGDIVYIHQQEEVNSGEIAAVLIDDEATLKRVRLFEDHIVLEPENPMYKPKAFWGEEMNTVRILGKAVAFTSIVR